MGDAIYNMRMRRAPSKPNPNDWTQNVVSSSTIRLHNARGPIPEKKPKPKPKPKAPAKPRPASNRATFLRDDDSSSESEDGMTLAQRQSFVRSHPKPSVAAPAPAADYTAAASTGRSMASWRKETTTYQVTCTKTTSTSVEGSPQSSSPLQMQEEWEADMPPVSQFAAAAGMGMFQSVDDAFSSAGMFDGSGMFASTTDAPEPAYGEPIGDAVMGKAPGHPSRSVTPVHEPEAPPPSRQASAAAAPPSPPPPPPAYVEDDPIDKLKAEATARHHAGQSPAHIGIRHWEHPANHIKYLGKGKGDGKGAGKGKGKGFGKGAGKGFGKGGRGHPPRVSHWLGQTAERDSRDRNERHHRGYEGRGRGRRSRSRSRSPPRRRSRSPSRERKRRRSPSRSRTPVHENKIQAPPPPLVPPSMPPMPPMPPMPHMPPLDPRLALGGPFVPPPPAINAPAGFGSGPPPPARDSVSVGALREVLKDQAETHEQEKEKMRLEFEAKRAAQMLEIDNLKNQIAKNANSADKPVYKPPPPPPAANNRPPQWHGFGHRPPINGFGAFMGPPLPQARPNMGFPAQMGWPAFGKGNGPPARSGPPTDPRTRLPAFSNRTACTITTATPPMPREPALAAAAQLERTMTKHDKEKKDKEWLESEIQQYEKDEKEKLEEAKQKATDFLKTITYQGHEDGELVELPADINKSRWAEEGDA